MKTLIMTTGERFDIEAIKPEIDEIVAAFDRYLDDYPIKTSRSMHSLMGPVPMILDGARVRKEDVATLVGRAVRAHEMNPRSKNYLPPPALAALETATSKLLALCHKVPVTAVTKVTERVRFGLYYNRRKKGIERLERTRHEFISFLRKRYANDVAFADAWNKPTLTFETAPFPSKNTEGYRNNVARKADIDAFHDFTSADKAILEQEDEDNE